MFLSISYSRSCLYLLCSFSPSDLSTKVESRYNVSKDKEGDKWSVFQMITGQVPISLQADFGWYIVSEIWIYHLPALEATMLVTPT